MVGVTSQGSNREVSRGPDQAGSATNQSDRNRNRNAGNKIQGPMEKHTPRPSLKYTCNQPQVSWLTAGLSL
ncbi:unnamed protein product [Staurois parvus]|uniref:Uncharacterized protein n=1 Tax=Staurois parvus TaxID=386267 RepID=A0ABN9ET89_9NEOB|nr:unnamed protein product [Staurois parvus]